jgi:uncharacterized membrane protein
MKTGCLAAYLLAALGTLAAPELAITTVLQYAALILLAGHVLELPLAYRYLERYPGPLIDSIALSLLFGVLHWLPLKRR